MRTSRRRRAASQFDLLPPSFHYHDRVRKLIRSWVMVVCMLAATLCAVTIATFLRIRHNHRTNLRIASAAIPLMQLRSDVIQLQESTALRERWCQWVESARPGDDMLQTLAAIAKASRSDSRQIMIDSLQVRLPIEFPATTKETPTWATPLLSVSARFAADDALTLWLDQLKSLDRIEPASIDESRQGSSDPEDGFRRVQLTATPRATRVMP